MRGKVHILVYCSIDTLHWGSTHSAMIGLGIQVFDPIKKVCVFNNVAEMLV